MSIAYSFPKTQRNYSGEGRGLTNSPSPDAYDPDRAMKIVKEQSPEWTFARSGRPGVEPGGPGPGEYDADINKLKMNVSYTMGSKRIDDNYTPAKTQRVPGPGTYDPTLIRNKSPSFTIGQKRQGVQYLQTPGPGHYDVSVSQNTSLKNSMRMTTSPFGSKSKRDTSQMYYASKSQILQSPGPGAYSPKHDAVKYKNPSTKIHKGMRGITRKDISPGPGAYNGYSKEMGKSTNRITMKGRPKTAKISSTPGPGQYQNLHKTITQSAQSQRGIASMKSKAERITSISRDQMLSPGPGAYDANVNAIKDRVKNVGFGKTKRGNLISKEEKFKPGPGNYNVPDTKSTKSFKIGQRINTSFKNNTPGPGNYDPNVNVVKDSIRNVKISNSQNKSTLYHSRSTIEIPGPGSYYNGNDFGKNVQTFSIRGKPRDLQRNDSPGPGHYDPSDALSKERIRSAMIKSGSTRQNNEFYQTIQSPGPGYYNDQTQDFGKNAKSFTIKSRPQERIDCRSPGPGAYDSNLNQVKESVRQFKMGISKRADIAPKTARDQPGPGAYDSPQKFGKEGPQYTMKSKRQELKRDDVPGPGAYNANDTINRDKSPSYRMGTASRTQIVSKETFYSPGPGLYDQRTTIGTSGPKYSFQPKQRDNVKDDNPGPGNYNPNKDFVKDKVVSYQMGTSQRQKLISRECADLPGPGLYNSPSKIGQDGPKYTMGGRSKSRQELSPGPGQYDPNNHLTKDSVRAFAMSKSTRGDIVNKSVTELPGPGAYSRTNEFGKDAKSFTMRGKPEDKIRNDVPGPGNYEPNVHIVKDRVIAHKISQSQRMDIVTKEMLYQPGPGEYDSPKRFGEDAPSVTIRGRIEDKIRDLSPGPGMYDPDHRVVKDKVISYKMGTTQRSDLISKQQYELPGPGIYDQHSSLGKTVAYTMGGKPKDQQDNRIPGPGSYDPKDYLTKDSTGAVFKMSQSQRVDIVSKEELNKPGPGLYQNHDVFGKDAKSFQIRGRPQDKVGNENPGPGNYNADPNVVKEKVVSYRMGTTTRSSIVDKERVYSPGPGQYDSPSKTSGPNYTMGGRIDSPSRNDVPGPGQYDPNESITKYASPTYKMDGKSQRIEIVSKEQQYMPGPGNYSDNRTFGQDAKSFQMRGRPQDKVGNDNPGPGNYDADANVVKDRVVTYKMGSSTRQEIVSKEQTYLPGPGQYDSPSRSTGPNYTMGSRRESPLRNNVPGPGEYDPNESITKYSSPTYKIDGKSQRVDIVSKEQQYLPGPGNYTDNKTFGQDAKSFSIRGKPHDKVGNDNPGPGNYDADANVVKDRVVSYKMGSTTRTDIVDKERVMSPGPGAYDQSLRQSGPNYTMGGRTESPLRNDVPGPGQYDPNDSITKYASPSYRMNDGAKRTSLVSKEQDSIPGPGNYYNNKNFGEDARSFQIRGKPQDNTRNDNPGPGVYDPNDEVTKYQSPSYKIEGGGKRSMIVSSQQMQLPGPGIYDQHSTIGRGPAVSIRGKPSPERVNDVPGPGTYDSNVDAIKDKTQNSFRIGTHKRDFLSISQDASNQPGPGFYDFKNQPSGPFFSIQGRQSARNPNTNPGPGAYEASDNAVRNRNPSIDFSRSPERSISPRRDDMPGPGQYYDDRDYDPTGNSVIVYSIPKGENKEPVNDTPGPGHYKIPVKFADVPRYNHTVQSEEFRWV